MHQIPTIVDVGKSNTGNIKVVIKGGGAACNIGQRFCILACRWDPDADAMIVACLIRILPDRRLPTILSLHTEGHLGRLAPVRVGPIADSGEANDVSPSRPRQGSGDAVTAYLNIQGIAGSTLLEANARDWILIGTSLSTIR